jgi:hypothetical protein
VEIEKIIEREDEEMTEEERKLSESIFAIAAPAVPMLLEQTQQLDPNIVGGFLVMFRTDGAIAVMTGNAPPSATVPILQKAISQLTGDKGFLETVYAEQKGKSN